MRKITQSEVMIVNGGLHDCQPIVLLAFNLALMGYCYYFLDVNSFEHDFRILPITAVTNASYPF